MKCLLNIFDAILIRLLGFSLAFFFGLLFIPQISQKQPSRLLNVEIYKRPTNTDCERPNPLILLVKIDSNNRITLNSQEFNLKGLEAKLSEIFKFRDEMEVKNYGETEIHKNVFIEPDYSLKYEDLSKIIDSINKTGASHIYIDPFKEYCHSNGGAGCGNKMEDNRPKSLKTKSLENYRGKSTAYFDRINRKKQLKN